MHFGGTTYDRNLDKERLSSQLGRVRFLMRDGIWRTLREIRNELGGTDTEAAISARLRDFRKTRFGRHTVNRRRRGNPTNGLFEYQLVLNTENKRKERRPNLALVGSPQKHLVLEKALRRYMKNDHCRCSFASKLRLDIACCYCQALEAVNYKKT